MAEDAVSSRSDCWKLAKTGVNEACFDALQLAESVAKDACCEFRSAEWIAFNTQTLDGASTSQLQAQL